jgi:branched-chain amino acid transport system substrate-binding protein
VLTGLDDKAKTMTVSQQTFEVTDPTVDRQLVTLENASASADTFINISTPKFAAQSIRKVAEMGWKPQQDLVSVSTSVSSVFKPAGFDNGQGILSLAYLRDPADVAIRGSREYQEYAALIKKYCPGGDPDDSLTANGYTLAQAGVEVLKQAGDNLTHDNIMKVASHLDLALPMLTPGIRLKTTPDDFYPVAQLQLTKFVGSCFEPFGPIIGR